MPDAPTPLDLDAIRARADARRDYADERPESLHVHEDYAALADESAADVPALIEEVKRLRAKVADLRREGDRMSEGNARLLAEVTRLTARPAPAWDEEAVRRAVGHVLTDASNYPKPAQVRLWGADLSEVITKATDAVLAVVRDHQPVSGESRAQVEAEALRDAADALAVVGRNPVGEPALVVAEEDLRARADRIEKGETRG